MKGIAVLAMCAAALMLVACGGKASNGEAPGTSSTSGGPSAQAPLVVVAQPLPSTLPNTIAPRPADLDSALAHAASTLRSSKHASALLSTIGAGSISVTSPPVSGAAHNFVGADGNVWAEAQDTATFNQYHVYGTVNSVQLAADGTSYATIGLCTWFTYDYALNQATPPNSAYLFNQNVYLLIRRVAADGPGVCRVRIGDYNGKTSNVEVLVATPFTYDLQLNPTNPIVSTPGAPPYTDHQCGVATFSIEGVPIPGAVAYGDDNWGWRTAAGPERYDALAGGALLLGQVYASGSSVTSALNFTATFSSGSQVNPQPDNSDWFLRGRDRSRRAESPWNGPQGSGGIPPGILWQQPVNNPFVSGPVLGPDGTVYMANGTTIRAYDGATGAPRVGWPVNDTNAGLFSAGTPAVAADGSIYAVASNTIGRASTLHAWNPNGSAKWPPVDIGFGAPGSAAWSGMLEFNGRLYFGAQIGTNNFFFVYDAATGAQVASTFVPDTGTISVNAPALAQNGKTLYWNTASGLHAFDVDGVMNWTWTAPGGASCIGSPPCIAPDSTVFVGASDHRLYALTDTGGGAVPNPAFAGGSVANACSEYTSVAIDDLGGGDYRVYSRDNAGAKALQCFNPAGVLQWQAAQGSTSVVSAPAIGADGKVYLSGGSLVNCFDPATGALVWQRDLGGGSGLNSPALNRAGTFFVLSDTALIALNDASGGVQIDATALPNASFSVYSAGGLPLTGTLDTDVVYDGSLLGFVPGSQFYVVFTVDNAASPNDLLVYPPRPDGTLGGLVTVNTTSLTLAPSLLPFFDNPANTLTLRLKPGAYNRIGNDETALTDALYSFYDTTANLTFSPGLTTRSSLGKAAVLAANTNYRIDLTPAAYPVAGSNGSFNGSPEAVYPKSFAGGFFSVGFGTLTEGGAVAGPDNDNTDFYDQAGLVNTLQPDAYCRFETTAGPLLASDYGFYDMNTGNWIIVPSFPFGREPQARPFDTFAFARSTAFQASDGANFSGTVTVTPGKQLNFVGYPGTVPLALGLSTLTLRPLPVRVWDDPAQPDPGQPGADVTGTGPWTVPLNFLLQFGQGPWTVELDADYGGAWDDGAPGRVYTVTGSPFTTLGLKTAIQTIPNTQPPGLYTFAIRVTDSAGSQYTYLWPNTVTLGAGAPGARGNWYMAGGNRTGNGQSAYVGPLTPGVRTPVWSTPSHGSMAALAVSSVLDSSDNSYFSVGVGTPSSLQAFSSTGSASPPWPITIPGGHYSGTNSACIGTDGTVYFGGSTTFGDSFVGIAAMNPNGTNRWYWTDFTDPGGFTVSDVASENGFVYVVISNSGNSVATLFTLDAATGGQINSANVTGTFGPGESSLSVSATGTVYYHADDRLFALSSNGNVLYTVAFPPPPQANFHSRAVIAPDGTIFVTSGDGLLYSFIDSGSGFLPNFTFNGGSVGVDHGGTPAIRDLGGSYWIYVPAKVGTDTVLQKYDQLGNLVATAPPVISGGQSVEVWPSIGADGTVYADLYQGVAAFDGVNLTPLWTCNLPFTPSYASPAIGSDGGLYMVDGDAAEYKIHD